MIVFISSICMFGTMSLARLGIPSTIALFELSVIHVTPLRLKVLHASTPSSPIPVKIILSIVMLLQIGKKELKRAFISGLKELEEASS